MSQYEFDSILQKYLDGKCTPEEEKVILKWYETFINQTEIPLSASEKKSLEQRIWSKIRPANAASEEYRPAIVRRIGRTWARIAIAACVVSIMLVISYRYFYQKHDEHSIQAFTHVKIPENYLTEYNDDKTVHSFALSDGSVIELQPQSTLYYPKDFAGSTRNVYLAGSGFFKIAHDSTRHFIVHTDEGLLAEVLGTSFYVVHDEITKKIEVAVVSGKVSVYEKKDKDSAKTIMENERIILTPNLKVSYKPVNNQFVTSLVEEPKPIERSSDGGKPEEISFVFDEAPVLKVLKALENSYGITIETENSQLNNCHFTGDITRQSLYDKLDIICKSIQSSYEVRGTVIYMKGEGCK